uniref:Transcription factor CBF/NF-Y/archaeal histone domain-containing protein n=1 Tax=Salix viminalis TaxID=40686 RepID=A0A6N2L5H3_SALVM
MRRPLPCPTPGDIYREKGTGNTVVHFREREREMETGKVVAEAEELPKAIVRRVVKDTLSRCSPEDSDIIIHKDALLAFSESARIFIHYLTATANDICKESKRQTMNAGDVFKALEDIEFPEFVGPLKVSLNDFKRKNGGKKEGSSPNKEVQKKRKTGGKSTPKKGDTGEK